MGRRSLGVCWTYRAHVVPARATTGITGLCLDSDRRGMLPFRALELVLPSLWRQEITEFSSGITLKICTDYDDEFILTHWTWQWLIFWLLNFQMYFLKKLVCIGDWRFLSGIQSTMSHHCFRLGEVSGWGNGFHGAGHTGGKVCI